MSHDDEFAKETGQTVRLTLTPTPASQRPNASPYAGANRPSNRDWIAPPTDYEEPSRAEEQEAIAYTVKITLSDLAPKSDVHIEKFNTNKRKCGCESKHVKKSLKTLEQMRQNSNFTAQTAFFLLTLVFAVVGAVGVVFVGIPFMYDWPHILVAGGAFLCVGGIGGLLLGFRTFSDQRNKLVAKSLAVLVVMVGAFALLIQFKGAGDYPTFLSLSAWGGMPLLRESFFFTTSFGFGLIGGWSFRLVPPPDAAALELPTYSDLNNELLHPHKEVLQFSYDDVIQRSKSTLNLIPASYWLEQNGSPAKCQFCYRTGDAIVKNNPQEDWLHHVLPCPSCKTEMCLQHYVDSSWQCRACGQSVVPLINPCNDGESGKLPSNQRPVLCPYCHDYKGCPDHYAKHGWHCPSCKSDVEYFVKIYGYFSRE